MIINLLICLFSIVMLLSSIMVVLSQNTIHSILFLMTSFFCAAGIMLVFKCEFLALVFLIIYVGAISILLLFVVMMTINNNNYNYSEIELKKKIPAAFILGMLFMLELYFITIKVFEPVPYQYESFFYNFYVNWYKTIDTLSDINTIGQVLYTSFVLQFLLIGVILTIGILGAIVLTVDTNLKERKQHTFKQLSRNYKNVFIKK